MPAPKGKQNNKRWADNHRAVVIKRIKEALKRLNRSGVAFKNVSSLADQIAPEVGQTANSLCRNPRYRVLLDEHLVNQKGAASLLDETTRDINALRAKMRALELKNANLEADNKRLRRFFQNQGKDPDQVSSANVESKSQPLVAESRD